MASSVEMPSHSSTVMWDGTRCPLLGPSSSRSFLSHECDFVVLGALPPSHAVALAVASLQVTGQINEVGVARMVDEGTSVGSQATPVVNDVQGNRSLSASQSRCA